jgi:hypothetical protein
VSVESEPRSIDEDGSRRNFLTTPRHCPDSGHWTFRLIVTYGDDTVDRARSRTPCRH